MGACSSDESGGERIYKFASSGDTITQRRLQYVREHARSVDVFRDKWGDTSLGKATINKNIDMMRVLLEAKANTSVQNREGWTPLHMAAANNFPDGVRLLLEHNADPTIRAKNKTPLDWAKQTGSQQCVAILSESRSARIAQLVDMGFDQVSATSALSAHNGDFEQALAWLIDDQLRRVQRERRKSEGEMKFDDVATAKTTTTTTTTTKGSDNDNDENENECVVCLSNKRDTVFVPCGHLIVCYECGSQLSSCPICRTPKQVAQRVYF